MKTNQMRKLSSALIISGSFIIAGCNGGTGGQNLTGTPITANAAKSLFTSNQCLTAKINFTGSSTWYVSGTLDVTNTCDTEIDLSKQTISFTSQDKNGNKVAVGTLNNWWVNNSAYKLNFTNGNANQQIGTVSAENGNAIIKAKQTISFNGGLNLAGSAFNNEIAQSTMSINGASPEPTPEPPEPVPPTPTPSDDYPTYPAQRGSYVSGTIVHGTDGALYQCLSSSVAPWCNSVSGEWAYAPGTGTYWNQAWKVVSSPAPVSTGSLTVVVDTSNANCNGSACGVVTANITNSSGSIVGSFTVPNSALGGKYTQSITDLKTGSYSVTSTTINQTTISYTPATANVKSNETSTITVKYDKTEPVAKTGTATINLGNYISNYTGDLQVAILNTKDNDKVVGNYVLKQGGSISTAELPVSDSTHVYRVKLTTGIADPLQGLYYIESGEPVLTINKDVSTSFTIPMAKSSVALKNVTLAVSGLENSDKANIVFSDAANKYNYVSYSNQNNGNVIYKLENGLNTGISVTASGNTNYVNNPITTTEVISASKTIDVKFAKSAAPTGASYDYIAPFKDYNNKIVLSVNGLTTGKAVVFTSNFQQKAGWGTCFGLSADNINFTNTKSGDKYLNTIAAKEKTNWDGSTSSQSLDLTKTCDVMGTDSGAEILPGVIDPIVYSLKVDNTSLSMNKPCAANGCKDPGNGYVNAGYYAQWSVWGRQYNPYNMPFDNINDIIYAFIGFNPATGDVKTLDASADSWGMSAVSRALLQYPYMKAHLSFGGWTNNGVNTAPMFEQLASSQTSMDNFAKQSIALMRKAGFTGIDIDWEWWSDYSNNAAPAQKMLTFYKTLRTALDKASQEDGKKYTLTIAVNGGSDRIVALEGKNVDGTSNGNPNAVSNFWSQVGGLMDYVNVMNYDYHGSWDTNSPAYFQANYDFQNLGTYKVGKNEGWSVKSSIDSYITRGVPAKKLVVGIPLYARTMTVSSSTNGGLFQNVTGAGFGDYENGILDYKCIINPVNNPVTGCGSDKPIAGVKSLNFYNTSSNTSTFNQYGLTSLQPWAYSAQTQSFMTYDDQWSATQKAKAVKSSGLGGTMYWELDGDAPNKNQSIVQSVKDEYNK